MLLLSALFGVGAALTLDEFALILHLDDVYWTDEGRSSIEATLMGFAFAALCLLATAPLGSDPSKDIPHWVLDGIIVVNMSFASSRSSKEKRSSAPSASSSPASQFSPPPASPSLARRGHAASIPTRNSAAAETAPHCKTSATPTSNIGSTTRSAAHPTSNAA